MTGQFLMMDDKHFKIDGSANKYNWVFLMRRNMGVGEGVWAFDEAKNN